MKERDLHNELTSITIISGVIPPPAQLLVNRRDLSTRCFERAGVIYDIVATRDFFFIGNLHCQPRAGVRFRSMVGHHPRNKACDLFFIGHGDQDQLSIAAPDPLRCPTFPLRRCRADSTMATTPGSAAKTATHPFLFRRNHGRMHDVVERVCLVMSIRRTQPAPCDASDPSLRTTPLPNVLTIAA